MNAYAAMLRAVNLGPHQKIGKDELLAAAHAAGLVRPETVSTSGNLVFESDRTEAEIMQRLGDALARHFGKEKGLFIRSAAELQAIVAANPFADRPGNLAMVLFLSGPPAADAHSGMVAPDGEQARLGAREIYLFYPAGQGRSKLKLTALKAGTTRNLNTVMKLAALAAARG